MQTELDRMIEALRHCHSREDYLAAMARCRIDVTDIAAFCTFDDDGYQRNRIDATDAHELVAICWRDGQATPIHNHGNSQCCVRVLQGELGEQRYVRGSVPGTALPLGQSHPLLPQDETAFDSAEDFHQLFGIDPAGSISLHLYVPPLQDCEVLEPAATLAAQAPGAGAGALTGIA